MLYFEWSCVCGCCSFCRMCECLQVMKRGWKRKKGLQCCIMRPESVPRILTGFLVTTAYHASCSSLSYGPKGRRNRYTFVSFFLKFPFFIVVFRIWVCVSVYNLDYLIFIVCDASCFFLSPNHNPTPQKIKEWRCLSAFLDCSMPLIL